MKKFNEENYQVGYFVTQGKRSRGTPHIVDIRTNKPSCNFGVDELAVFIFKSFDIKDATCTRCQSVINGLKKQAWKKY